VTGPQWFEEAKRFVRFNAVGVATTAVGIPVMAGLDGLGVDYPVYTAVNYLLGIALGFWLNFRYAFGDKNASVGTALGRYLVTFLGLLLVVQGLQWAVVEGAGWHRWWGVGLGMVVYGGAGYALSVGWVFQPPKPEVKP